MAPRRKTSAIDKSAMTNDGDGEREIPRCVRGSDMPDYRQWIANHQPTDPRGQCANMTLAMAEAFPELRRVRGHYVCPFDGRRPHWWMVSPSGEIIDPTAEQFASCGLGEYEEYVGPEPKGHCLNCGALLFEDRGFCNAACAVECVEWMSRGGTIAVNGKRLWPDPDEGRNGDD